MSPWYRRTNCSKSPASAACLKRIFQIKKNYQNNIKVTSITIWFGLNLISNIQSIHPMLLRLFANLIQVLWNQSKSLSKEFNGSGEWNISILQLHYISGALYACTHSLLRISWLKSAASILDDSTHTLINKPLQCLQRQTS